MLKCMDCGTEGVSGIHGCNWTGKDSPVTRVEFDALVQRLNTDERRAWDANARINDAVFDLTQRVAALEASSRDTPSRLDKIEWDMRAQGAHVRDCAARDHDGHDAACARGIEMAAAALDRVAKLEKNHIADAGKMVADPPADARLRELAEAVVHYYEATDPKSRAVQVLSAYLRETAR